MHIPVLLNEVLENLNPKSGEFFIDGTINGGGHAREILKKIEPNGILLGTDLDEEIIKKSKDSIESKKAKVILVHSNYADLLEVLKKQKLPKADGLLLDLGFSSEQLESSNKGFSFLKDEVLDMRYDANSQQSIVSSQRDKNWTAAEVVNSYSEKDLADIFYKYGEERFSRRIARAIIEERRKKRILTTLELAEIIKNSVPKSYERGRIHPATRTFQALRIYINQELENLQRILGDLEKIMKPSGRVAIISFHSLEDRIVKHFFKQIEKEKKGKIITKKPIIAKNEEIKINPRSRSAKLRVIEMTM